MTTLINSLGHVNRSKGRGLSLNQVQDYIDNADDAVHGTRVKSQDMRIAELDPRFADLLERDGYTLRDRGRRAFRRRDGLPELFATIQLLVHMRTEQEWRVCFTYESFRQFCKVFALPYSYLEKLHRERRKDLLIENIQHCVTAYTNRYSDDTVSLQCNHIPHNRFQDDHFRYERYYRDGDTPTHLLEWVEPISRRRRSRRIVLDGIRDAIGAAGLNFDEPIRVYATPDGLCLEYLFPESRSELAREGDEAMAGFKITDSEGSLVVELIFIRLICTNGMTTSSSKKYRIPKSSIQESKDGDRREQEWLDKRAQEDVAHAINKAIRSMEEERKEVLTELQRNAIAMLNEKFDFPEYVPDAERQEREFDENEHRRKVKFALETTLWRGGLRMVKGLSIDDIYDAYCTEIENDPSIAGTAYGLYNAFTRYATRTLVEGEARPSRTQYINEWARFSKLYDRLRKLAGQSFDWRQVRQITEEQPKLAPRHGGI